MLQTTYLESRGAFIREQSLRDFRREPTRLKKHRPLPVAIMEEYKQLHNAQVIRQDRLSKARKYVLAPYSCPDRAGNALHNIYNSVLWAIATNRTLLLHFDESNTNHNTLYDCEEALRLQAWVPLWKDMKDYLPTPVPVPLDISRRRFDEIHSVVLYPQIPNVMADWKGSPIKENDWDDHPFKAVSPEFLADMPKSDQLRLKALYSHGLDFLYGMLFRSLFNFQVERPKRALFQNEETSIVLHSRHIVNADDGTYTNEEEDCLHQLLNRSDIHSTEKICTIYLLSDRFVTVDKLVDFLKVHYPSCQTRRNSATQPRNATGKRALEHGANPGVGFFQDLALGIQARSGIIGEEHRSSFKLIQEIIAFDSIMEKAQEVVNNESTHDQSSISADLELLVEQYGTTHHHFHNPIEMCSLNHRKGKGYSYPGSPTFIRRERLPTLGPAKVWDLYREQHKQSTLESEYRKQGPDRMRLSKRLFSIARFSCDRNDKLESNYLDLTNRFILSMLSDRTTLVYSENPNCIHQLAPWIPRWDEWSPKLNLSQPIDRPDIDAKTVEFPQKVLSLSLLQNSKLSATLHEFGPRYLRGLIGRDLFAPMWSNVKPMKRHEDVVFLDRDFSVAVDLRFEQSNLVEKVGTCLEQVLANVSKPTQFFLVEGKTSSRKSEGLLDLMGKQGHSINVTRSSATHQQNAEDDYFGEFWRSWAIGGRARQAWIGPDESMIRNEIEFQRVMEVRSIGVFPLVVKDLPTCIL